MEHEQIWSKQVHPNMEATPSMWLVYAHGVPKDFDPSSPDNKAKLAIANVSHLTTKVLATF